MRGGLLMTDPFVYQDEDAGIEVFPWKDRVTVTLPSSINITPSQAREFAAGLVVSAAAAEAGLSELDMAAWTSGWLMN